MLFQMVIVRDGKDKATIIKDGYKVIVRKNKRNHKGVL
jgi:hypothetical protein